MTIDRAIGILELVSHGIGVSPDQELISAAKLGIEALKRIRHDRKEVGSEHYIRLTGETEK